MCVISFMCEGEGHAAASPEGAAIPFVKTRLLSLLPPVYAKEHDVGEADFTGQGGGVRGG